MSFGASTLSVWKANRKGRMLLETVLSMADTSALKAPPHILSSPCEKKSKVEQEKFHLIWPHTHIALLAARDLMEMWERKLMKNAINHSCRKSLTCQFEINIVDLARDPYQQLSHMGSLANHLDTSWADLECHLQWEMTEEKQFVFVNKWFQASNWISHLRPSPLQLEMNGTWNNLS